MADLSGETAASQAGDLAGMSETRPDKQSGEELSACLKGTHWSRLPNEMQIEIPKQKDVDDGEKLNLLCANPNLLPVIISSYSHDNANSVNEEEGTEAEPSRNIYIKYSSEKKMFSVEMGGSFDPKQPHKIFGVKHDEIVLVDLDSKSEHATILLNALRSTSTTARKLYFVMNEVDFQLSLDFVEVLKPVYLRLDFNTNEKWSTLNEVVEAFPALFELNELRLSGPVHADGNSLFNHFSKFPPSLCFNNNFFSAFLESSLHIGNIVKFLKTLASTKFEEGSPTAVALKRLVNWTFGMDYETKTEEGDTMNGHKFLSELVEETIPLDWKIVDLDSATDKVKRRIFELHLAVGDEQHVIYVKEEVDHSNRYRAIQLANQTADMWKILFSPNNSIMSDMDEQMSILNIDPNTDFSDAGDEFMDDDH